jgi:2,4-diaminopentanoate dehydrogenase
MGEAASGDVRRVVVWSTGGIGSLSIVAVGERPDLELVGVWVHSKDKVGRDAGELANGVPIGIEATDDVDALIALEPDCVIYAASGPERDAGAVPDYERLLAAGINVVTTTSTTLINPLAYVPAHRERLEAATKTGGSSIYASGIEPGFLCDHLPIIFSSASRSIGKVHCYEMALYDDYGVREIMIDALGFGQPLDFEPWIDLPGAIAGEFEGQIRYIADGLGVSVDEVRETYDRRLTDKPIETAFGTVEPGTCGAIRFQAIGVVDGREAIVIDHITRLARHVGTDWPIGEADLSYNIKLEGKPNFDIWVTPSLDDPAEAGIPAMGSGAGAMLATAMRVVNAVPYVVDAEPGLLRSLELPVTIPTHVFRPVGP